MEVIEEKLDGVHIFTLEGRLDSNTAPGFEETLFSAMQGESRHILLNCEDLAYISSAGLRVILKATKALASEGAIRLCSLRDYVREVFEISGFDTFLSIDPSLDDALKAFVRA